MTTSDMELAAKYLRTNDVGDAAGEACQRIATALEGQVSRNRQKIINAAGVAPPAWTKPDRMASGDTGWAQGSRGRYKKS